MTTNGIFGRLSGWEFLEIKGSDAPDFLQRLTTVHLRQLEPGRFSPGTLLQSNGKLILYFKLLIRAPGSYLFLIPPGVSAAAPSQFAFESFEKVHFMEELAITPLENAWSYYRVLGKGESELQALLKTLSLESGALSATGRFEATDQVIALREDRWNAAGFGFDLGLLLKPEAETGLKAAIEAAGYRWVDSFEPYRIQSGDPAVPGELNAQSIPLEAGLDDAIHQNKGCYPGQEVIERIRAMGQVPRRLAVLRGAGATPAFPQAINVSGEAAEQNAGTLTSAAPLASGQWVGLGFIKRVFANQDTVGTMSFTVAGAPVSVQLK